MSLRTTDGKSRKIGVALTLVATVLACGEAPPAHTVIPLPASVDVTPGVRFSISAETPILFDAGDAEGERIAQQLAELLRSSLGVLPRVGAADGSAPVGSIALTRDGLSGATKPEGYRITIDAARAELRAETAAGLFYGVQTLRQLLPPEVEYSAAFPRSVSLPAIRIEDAPRFGWRGAMLDVARHFLPGPDVKRFIDVMALYKLNILHLHLSDDQGWRIEVAGWPELTARGGRTEVGGGEGGYYTSAEYAELVGYAAERFITIVPEIDVPGHTNAALASYADLNCDGEARDLYTGTAVGFSSLCVDKPITYSFLEDVVREISALTPGPFFHVGGDEVEELTLEEYVAFIGRMQEIVASEGKRMVGWDEVAEADLPSGSIVQLWRPLWAETEPGEASSDSARAAAVASLESSVERAIAAGATVVMSPADRVYLDMKYDSSTTLGLSWAGFADTRRAYDWDPAALSDLIPEEAIEGVEAPLWSETLGTLADFEFMALPRLAGVAELAWSPQSSRSWEEYRRRLGAHAVRWQALGVRFHRAPGIPWDDRGFD